MQLCLGQFSFSFFSFFRLSNTFALINAPCWAATRLRPRNGRCTTRNRSPTLLSMRTLQCLRGASRGQRWKTRTEQKRAEESVRVAASLPLSARAAATAFWVEKMLQAAQRHRAPSADSVSISTCGAKTSVFKDIHIMYIYTILCYWIWLTLQTCV